jgi:hypothetical protein
MKRALALAAVLLLAHSTFAFAADRLRLVSVPLDMPESTDNALDHQYLEGLYNGDYGTHMTHNFGGYLGHNVKSSGLEESPFYHIDTKLKDGRTLELWFSTKQDGRATFGIKMSAPSSDKPPTRSYDAALKELEAAYGKPDLDFSGSTVTTQHIFVFNDSTAPNYEAIAAALPKASQIAPKDADEFWHCDLRAIARILGPDFRGAIAILNNQNGKLSAEDVELLDLHRARTVFNLDNLK